MKTQSKNKVLTTENLSIGYRTKKAHHIVASDIDLSIEKGKLVTVLGKNGIGKSTLLRTIAKVQKPLNGNVFINNKNLETYAYQELATALSMVLTERLPESQLTVFELVALGRQPYTNWIDKLSDIDLEKVNWALDETEIHHLKHKRFYELSDGQLQRVLIARALAQDTEIIILDEPTSAIDPLAEHEIFEKFRSIAQGKILILITHRLYNLKMANKIVVMDKGEIIETGNHKTLVEQKGKYFQMFPSKGNI